MSDAEQAELLLWQAGLIVAAVVTPIVGVDVVIIRKGLVSISNAGGVVWRRFPKTCWSAWIGLGLHIWLKWRRDPLDALGRRIRRRRGAF